MVWASAKRMTTRTTIQMNVTIPGLGGFLRAPEPSFESVVIIFSLANQPCGDGYNCNLAQRPASCASYRSFQRIYFSCCRQHLRQIQTGDADPVVGHAVVDIEAIRQSEVVATIDAGWEHDVGDGPVALRR